ncbi:MULTISPECIES: lytic murein transglycosylase [Rhizobium]|mgnify:FL=1|jgi:lytic murein transglycosylase|uniref:Lytic murein transglycosylase n=1 Tax=Rhizobium lusitanum TaxID=293958 RepID=A0A1C3VUU7_9HYPH|nr:MULTISPECIES: lytic murein transglycosylase [Rhizobium]NKJ07753.1 lytic murein transglycosylase [Rhizobium sp. SG741]NKJ37010.1 lytic murein transglycosylase [Rhizobium sp. SG570]NTJ07575.1 lytic murein transglycosylase [Rhizobium lusitanum]SCB31528.1 lytic murein transglycosylase [Rhizobium lusitanum]
MDRYTIRRNALALIFASAITGAAMAQSAAPAAAPSTDGVSAPKVACGGDLAPFLAGVKAEAIAAGADAAAADRTLAGAQIDPKVLSMDRGQGVFRQTFLEFSQRTVSQGRLDIGRQKMKQYADVFAKAEKDYGVAPGVITAFWAMETDFGAVQGNFNTRNALVTLAHDCRRPDFFRPRLIALIELVQRGDVDPETTTGAWAGEIGQTQMLPPDIIAYGTDGDGDGHVNLKTSAPDVILTTARFLQHLGFQRGQPWLQEVTVPDNLPWEKSGIGGTLTAADWFQLGVKPRDGNTSFGSLPAALILPQGRKGPAFLTYPNYNAYLGWNQSFIYTTSAAYFATRFAGAPPYNKGTPEPGLNDVDMKTLQTKLVARGYDVGKIDGILGSGTRIAIQKEQFRLGMPADGWATSALLGAL